MCYPLPGVRCASAAKKRLQKLRKQMATVTVEYDKTKHGRDSAKKDGLLQEIERLHVDLNNAERDYHASFEGLARLREQVENAKTPREKKQLSDTLEIAEFDHASQMLAHDINQRQKQVPGDRQARIDAIDKNIKRLSYETAEALNRGEDIRSKQAMLTRLKSYRNQYVEMYRRHVIGVDALDGRHVRASSLTQLADGHSFLPLKASDFGRAHTYIPYGAYGKITKASQDEQGNITVEVEGRVQKKITPNDIVYSLASKMA